MAFNLNEDQKKVLAFSQNVINEVKKVVIGKDEIIIKVLLSILSGGHILIEDIPGVGKTTLAIALSKALSLDYKRMQFTPDVLPSDVTGFSVLDKQTNEFRYKEGAAMTNLFLADEINRTSSKTQSALLEVMEEGKVTVDGVTHNVPDPYIVIATQNPMGSIGTQMLPESQLDRFLVRLTMGYPSFESEINMLKSKNTNVSTDEVKGVATKNEIILAKKTVDDIYVSDEVMAYIAALANATRNNSSIKLGLSPRGSIALLKISKATALLKGRDYVIPDDILYCFEDVVKHRLIFESRAKLNGTTHSQIIQTIISSVQVPRING
ncbi:MAG: MoxR family ATPase [Ruminococcus sp.]|jgi:MoxR-like ATPase|nr:MoxR family ATPase [Ruminococcus sp.]